MWDGAGRFNPNLTLASSEYLFGRDLAEWLERLTAKAVVATVLGSIPASSDTVESEGRADEAVLKIVHKKIKNKKIPIKKKHWDKNKGSAHPYIRLSILTSYPPMHHPP